MIWWSVTSHHVGDVYVCERCMNTGEYVYRYLGTAISTVTEKNL